ncbi:MAG: AAA family ATPase [Opitutaceae bacterium]|nr:AAA family ATPase [Opitutaceae bacterium]
MARKISFINYKGGVGKTSLIINVAACLALEGKRVLLCDMDTQSNASIWLLRLERWNLLNSANSRSLYSIFHPGNNINISDCLVKDVLKGKDGESLLPGLDLLPTTFDLVELENEFKGEQPAYVMFQEQLAEVEDQYDFILFDCPPNILRASQCGVFSSGEIYVPANPDALSLIGFTLLVEKLFKFHQVSAGFRRSGMSPMAQIHGIIFNAIKAGVDIDVPKMRMQLRMNQFRNQKRVSSKAKIFETQIRDATVVRRAVTLGLPVILLGKDRSETDGVGGDYRQLASEIMRHDPMG